MASVCGSILGIRTNRFQSSLLVNKIHLNNLLMFSTRKYTCLTGKVQSATRNLQCVSINSNVQSSTYAAQQVRSSHGHVFLPLPILSQQPTLTTKSTILFAALRNKLWANSAISSSGFNGARCLATVNQYRWGKVRTKADMPKKIIPKSKMILLGPQRKGVCIKVFTRKPKKPNSGNRKCALLKLSNGKVITAYIPGEGAVLQEHGVVLFEGGRVQDCPGIKYKIIRGKYDMN